MPRSTASLLSGFDYQARWFWVLACRLFHDHTKVARVGYEVGASDGFDDIVVSYGTPIPSERGDLVVEDHYQIKYHTDLAGAFTCASLMDPSFLRTKSQSLLQRLAVLPQAGPGDPGHRVLIVSNWSVDPSDSLAKLVSGQGGEIRLDVLLQARDRSAVGKVRAAWCAHLNLNTREELAQVLRPLRIRASAPGLAELAESLNGNLMLAGLRPVPSDVRSHPYDDLIKKLQQQGRARFDRQELRQICEQEGLWQGVQMASAQTTVLGLRSFLRWAEFMEDETDAMLCLLHHFEGRKIRNPRLWSESVFPEVSCFLRQQVRPGNSHYLHLDVHSSIAFAAGYCLDSKCGAEVVPVQRTRMGRSAWKSDPCRRPAGSATWSCQPIRRPGSGTDVALAVSVTHDIIDDVEHYTAASLPSVGRILPCSLPSGVGSTAVRDGTHALHLAQQLSTLLKTARSPVERSSVLHIFSAAPNALVFLVGQLARSFGRCVVYEHDLDGNAPGAYEPSISFPPMEA